MKWQKITLLALFGGMALPLWAAPILFRASYEDKEQPPYYMGESTEVLPNNPGVAVEMVAQIEKKIPELKIQLLRQPWKRCLSELKDGKVDGIFNASFKSERLEMGAYPMKEGQEDATRRLTTIAYSLYKHKEGKIGWDGKNFTNLRPEERIGAPLGYSIVGDLQKMGVSVEESKSTITNFNKLELKRLAAVAAQDITGDALLQKGQEFKDLVKVSPPLVSKPYYLMISHQFIQKYPGMAEKIWEAIATMREQEMETIAKKYQE